MSSAISIETLSMKYGAAGSGHRALDEVSLDIRDNEFPSWAPWAAARPRCCG